MHAPELLVFNQIDKLEPGADEVLTRRHGGVAVSALRGTGLRALLGRAERTLWAEDDGRLTRQGGLKGLSEA
jgi:50S ribosomal subunit-associated GTPase HflX